MKPSFSLFLLVVIFLSGSPARGGDFDGAAGLPGSRAIALDDPRIRSWAEAVASYQPGEDLDAPWQDPGQALGPATGDPLAVTGLGRGGSITFVWDLPLLNGPGPDIAVFENSFSDRFLELAHVEVSSDGEHWQRFSSISQTPGPVGSFGLMDPSNLSGLAGKYRATFGTGFDFSDLPPHPFVDAGAIRFIRLVDVVGDGRDLDSQGQPIYDPYPTFGSAGFDLDALAVLEPMPMTLLGAFMEEDRVTFSWSVEAGATYRLERLPRGSPEGWQRVKDLTAEGRTIEHEEPLGAGALFRLRELSPASG